MTHVVHLTFRKHYEVEVPDPKNKMTHEEAEEAAVEMALADEECLIPIPGLTTLKPEDIISSDFYCDASDDEEWNTASFRKQIMGLK